MEAKRPPTEFEKKMIKEFSEPAKKLATEPYVWDGPRGCPVGEPGVPGPVGQDALTGPRGVARPTIALCVMTKNGAKKLPRLFESVAGFADSAIVLDTGSTDGTDRWVVGQRLLPFAVFQRPFVDFATSRNQLFELAQGRADWLLLLDDDMFLDFAQRPTEVRSRLNLEEPAYMLKHAGNMAYWVSRVVRGDRLWKYSGVTHEYLVGVNGTTAPHLEGVEIGHNYNHGPEKFERDLRLLSADIARDPEDARTIFYLANTLRDMGKIGPAIRFYCMRANMDNGWDQEQWLASYEAARLANDPGAMKEVYLARPSRAEAPAWLALYYKSKGNAGWRGWERIRAKIPMTTDVLFVIQSAYDPELKGL